MKINFLIPSLFIAMVLLNSCSKEDVLTNDVENSTQGIEKVVFNVPGAKSISTSGTMLSFSSFEEFESTVSNLVDLMDVHEDVFVRQYEHLNDEELNAIELSTGFVSQQPLIDFEEQYGFTNSLRKKYNELEAVWLNNEELDPTTDPDNTIYFSAAEQTLLNEHQEVMVAGKVYVFSKMSDTYEVHDDYGTSLAKINNNEDVSQDPNITSYEKSGASCTLWKSSNTSPEYATNRKAKRIATFRWLPYYGKSKVKVISYKKSGNSWNRWRTDLGVGVQSYLYNSSCSTVTAQGWSGMKRKKSKELKKTNIYWGNSVLQAKNNLSVRGTYEYNGYSSNYNLQW
ncbi:MAG: hypothetical protein H0X63_06980 [Flavobacteriales bacterium]|nr:hypothetical protein [Flavobacteriales bacterium]